VGRWAELALGLMIGTVFTVALVAAVRPGAVAVDGASVLAAVRDRLPAPKPRRDRALPDDSRDRDCQLAAAVNAALSATVARKAGDDGDFPTHEARLDALLDATRCERLGRLYTLEADPLTSIADVVERVARRSGRLRGEPAARGWATRSWAFGLELLLADPERLATPGLRFAQAGVNAALESLERQRPALEDTAALLLISRTLRARTPPPEEVFGLLGLEALRRALSDETIPVDGPEGVDADVRAAPRGGRSSARMLPAIGGRRPTRGRPRWRARRPRRPRSASRTRGGCSSGTRGRSPRCWSSRRRAQAARRLGARPRPIR
jgi:hypothetical protein